MKLRCLLAGIVKVNEDQADLEIKGLASSSQEIEPGFAFLALPGKSSDGHLYIDQAIQMGASVIFSSKKKDAKYSGVAWQQISRLKDRLQELANRFYGFPDRKMRLFAITGTNGKTSSAWLFAAALNLSAETCGYIGTLGSGIPPDLRNTELTTPGLICLYRELNKLLEKGARTVVLEVSSHALAQNRLGTLRIECAWFTNIAKDHLEYHQGIEGYKNAKKLLFTRANVKTALINADDSFGSELKHNASGLVFLYGRRGDVALRHFESSYYGMHIVFTTRAGSFSCVCNLIGMHNAKNLEGVVLALLVWGLKIEQIASALPELQSAPGRAELLSDGLRNIVIDYAHTADALREILRSVRLFTVNKIWCLFGCGGDRDYDKRAEMGCIASRFADYVILTDDNPRSEPPEEIVQGIIAGMTMRPYVIHDRSNAISYALNLAEKGDTVLIAGKGDERIQRYKDSVRPFHDRSFVESWLKENKNKQNLNKCLA